MQELLKVNNLGKTYQDKNKKTVAVDNISFNMKEGEIIGILGPNGAGKTTTIKCICGLVSPTSGNIFIDEVDVVKNTRFCMSKVSAVLEGTRNIYWRLTPRENLSFFAGLQGISRRESKSYIDELIESFKLKEKENTQSRYLSKGMQQKLAIACCIVKNTPIILLDEPTLGLDVEFSFEIRALIKELSKKEARTVFLSSHDMDVVKDVCERVVIINKGKIVTDETVDKLSKLFQTSSYTVEVGALNQSQIEEIKTHFDLVHIIEDNITKIDVDLPSSDNFYTFIDTLKTNNVKINSISRKEPDFEEIYLKIIKDA